MKLTQWHDGKVKPVYEGVYETENNSIPCYQYWNGKHWKLASSSVLDAYNCRDDSYISLFQDDKWRGLANKPRSKK